MTHAQSTYAYKHEKHIFESIKTKISEIFTMQDIINESFTCLNLIELYKQISTFIERSSIALIDIAIAYWNKEKMKDTR